MTQRRDFPYLWITHLTGLLSGDNSCEFARWFSANHRDYAKTERYFDAGAWQTNHTALLNDVRSKLEAEGRTVWTEGQNRFHFDGRAATVGGKADLVSRNSDGLYSVHDAKTGRPKDSDVVQIQLYIFFLRLAEGRYKGVEMDGWVEYKDSRVYVPTDSVNAEFKQRTIDLIKRLAAVEPARIVPSESDCRYCDLTIADCPSRIESEEVRTVTEMF